MSQPETKRCPGSPRYEFPGIGEYALDRRCPRCKAGPGEPCVIGRPRTGGRGNAIGDSHAARADAGWRHWQRDIGRAPWPEDRVPGTEYHSLRHVQRHGSGWNEIPS